MMRNTGGIATIFRICGELEGAGVASGRLSDDWHATCDLGGHRQAILNAENLVIFGAKIVSGRA
jgi:hypothetical protein